MLPASGATEANACPRRLPSFHVLVALATLGAWWLLPSYAHRLLPWPVAEASRSHYLVAAAAGLALAALWGLLLRWLAGTLFEGAAARRRVAFAAALGSLLFATLAALELRAIYIGGQPPEFIASMHDAPPSTTAPAGERLAARLRQFYEAFGARDAGTLLEMSRIPGEPRATSLRQFRSDLGLGRDWASRPAARVNARFRVCACTGWSWEEGTTSTRCLLLVEGTQETAGGQRDLSPFLDTWHFRAGEWYHDCPGPAAGTCPADPYAEGYCRSRFALDGQ
jgi:hypothetical protein